MKEPIGEKDRTGREICEGDIVEFWYSYDLGYSKTEKKGYTQMVDVVKQAVGNWYFCCEKANNGCFAWRANTVARVVGNIHDGDKVADYERKKAK